MVTRRYGWFHAAPALFPILACELVGESDVILQDASAFLLRISHSTKFFPAVVSSFVLMIVCVPAFGLADDISLMSIGARYGISGNSPIGEQSQEEFEQYDAAVTFRMPWTWYHASGWGFSTRLIASAGVLKGASDEAFIATLVPVVAFGRKDERISIDMGGGGALMSSYRFGTQDFGGPFQFVWAFGLNCRVYGPVGLGYHFQHYSDAGIYGTASRGIDLHMIELAYRF
ncbi:MAG: acyloxyacyl hydrolase [Nitrospiraceae bacterium]